MCKFERGGANNQKKEVAEKYMYVNSDFQFQCPAVHNPIFHTTTHSSYTVTCMDIITLPLEALCRLLLLFWEEILQNTSL